VGAVFAIATETCQLWKAEEKCSTRAWYWVSSGGRIDQEVVEGIGVDWKSVGGGGRQRRVKAGKSSVNGS
tara:strand:+ start:407 stop:616 length:210 start_codon:yes stop_codon:yes gene_type:complete